MGNTKDKIIIALDGLSKQKAIDLAWKIDPKVYALKIHDLYDRYGAEIVKSLKVVGPKIWVDVKLHDIPKTVENRAKALRDNGADIITVHATGGFEMMQSAKQNDLIVYGISVLTSLDEEFVKKTFSSTIDDLVLSLALDAKSAGLDGVVCSPKEVNILSSNEELTGLEFIVPGVRSVGVDVGDQKRVDTPANALEAGATRIVIGRQITNAQNPVEALRLLTNEVKLVS